HPRRPDASARTARPGAERRLSGARAGRGGAETRWFSLVADERRFDLSGLFPGGEPDAVERQQRVALRRTKLRALLLLLFVALVFAGTTWAEATPFGAGNFWLALVRATAE